MPSARCFPDKDELAVVKQLEEIAPPSMTVLRDPVVHVLQPTIYLIVNDRFGIGVVFVVRSRYRRKDLASEAKNIVCLHGVLKVREVQQKTVGNEEWLDGCPILQKAIDDKRCFPDAIVFAKYEFNISRSQRLA